MRISKVGIKQGRDGKRLLVRDLLGDWEKHISPKLRRS